MGALTIELPSHEEQIDFNLRRWAELLADPVLAKFEGRIETDRYGNIIMSPPPAFSHGSYQAEIVRLLNSFLSDGRCATECPISTPDGVRAADVAWISYDRLEAIGENVCLTKAPEVCIEVLSPRNPAAEMQEKKALYFAAGALEVWFCGQSGKMTFFTSADSKGELASALCPNSPGKISLRRKKS